MHFYSSSSDDAHYYQDALANHNVLKNLISDYEENEYYKEQKKFKNYNCYVCLCLILFVAGISYSALYLYEYYHPEMLHIDSNHTNHTHNRSIIY